MGLGPGLFLAALIVLAATQAMRVLRPHRGSFLRDALISAAGFLVGEVVAATGHLATPAMGAVHPLADVALIAALHAASQVLSLTTAAA